MKSGFGKDHSEDEATTSPTFSGSQRRDSLQARLQSKSLIPSIYAAVSLFRQVGMINAVKRQKRQWRRRLLHNRQDDS